MFGANAFAWPYWGQIYAGVAARRPRRFGHGGSGMSDETYERLLRRLGAMPPGDGTDDDLLEAVSALRELDLL